MTVKDEQHHDGAGVDDDLRGGQELRAQQQVKHGQRGHHHNQRQGAVDGMALEQEVDGSGQAESGKEKKQDQVHRSLKSQTWAGKKGRPVKGKDDGAKVAGSVNPSRL
jgi:hypothetical protein